ncbi:Uncharacterised protein [Shigella sonnei]|nr:Uncharacterised protein [Shigella sonnei]
MTGQSGCVGRVMLRNEATAAFFPVVPVISPERICDGSSRLVQVSDTETTSLLSRDSSDG